MDRINDGTAEGMMVMPDDLPDPVEFEGEDVPPVHEYMKKRQKNGSSLLAEEIFRNTY